MAWNEPGSNGPKNPWGKRPSGGGKLSLDKVLKALKGRFGGGPGGILSVLLALLLAWLLLSSYVMVDARQVGVVQRFGAYARTLSPGFHLKLPRPIESVTKVATTQVRSVSDQVRMLTSDENIVTIDFNVQYQVSDARKFLFKVRDPEDTLRQAAEAAVRTVVGATPMDGMLASTGAAQPASATSLPDQTRDTLQQRTRQILQTVLDNYDAGMSVDDVSFQNVMPPQEVKDAFDDVNAAREDKQGAENQARAYASKVIPVAKGQAARIAAEAEGYQAERVARATGDAERFNLILKAYHDAPDVTRRRLWLETVEEVLAKNPKVLDGSGGRNLLYLPLSKSIGKDLPDAAANLGPIPPAADSAAPAQEKQP